MIRAAEVEAIQEDLFRRHGGNYSLQTRAIADGTMKELNDPSQTSASRTADLVRAGWQLAELRKTIDDAFEGFDLVALRTNQSAANDSRGACARRDARPNRARKHLQLTYL